MGFDLGNCCNRTWGVHVMTSPNLLAPYIKITLGKIGDVKAETFTIGDGKLVEASIELGEGTLQSNCSFSVRDPNRKLLDKYLAYIESAGGLDPVVDPNELRTTVQSPEDPATASQPGRVIYENTQASTYGYGEATQGGTIGAYGDRINFDGLFAAMVSTRYKYASMRVTNLANNKSIVVKIVDRGPFAVENGRAARPLREHPTRKIDLTRGAWRELTNGAAPGIINVRIEWLQPGTSTATETGRQATKQQKDAAQTVESNRQLSTIPTPSTPQAAAASSVVAAKSAAKAITPPAQTLAGAQITVELGFNGNNITAFSFIHTGLRYSLFDPDLLEFRGQASTWAMSQRIKNTIYQKLTFRKVAQKICSSYGMTLQMSEEGPLYQFFPQHGQNDYEFLLAEARRIGYRVHVKGVKLTIEPREKITPPNTFVLEYGVNMGLSFEITHQAESDSQGGARSSDPGNKTTTGLIKYAIDPDTGKVRQTKKESSAGLGTDTVGIISGSTLPVPKPKTDGTTAAADSQRRENEKRVKGIQATASFPTTEQTLLITPDSPFQTKGISVTADRFWVVASVKHNYSGGAMKTDVSLYSPLKNKRPTTDVNTSIQSSSASSVPFDADAPAFIRPTTGPITSKHRTENPRRPTHKGIDYGAPTGTAVVAAAAGTVTNAVTGCRLGDRSCGGRYGNWIEITHGGGWTTRYAHLSAVNVTVGVAVSRGQKIGEVGNLGDSSGPHLHWEIRKDGADLNPRRFVPD